MSMGPDPGGADPQRYSPARGSKFRRIVAMMWVVLLGLGTCRTVVGKDDGLGILVLVCVGWVGARIIDEAFALLGDTRRPQADTKKDDH